VVEKQFDLRNFDRLNYSIQWEPTVFIAVAPFFKERKMIKMKYIKYTLSLMLALLIHTVQAQQWSIAFSPVDVDCVANTACYNVLMKSSAQEFEIGSANLRLFYNAGTQQFLKTAGAVNVNKGYQISNQRIKNQTASLEGKGDLSFDASIGLLDIPIDFYGDENEAMKISSSSFAVLASNICFESSDKNSIANPADFVWVTEKTKQSYTTAETTINQPSGKSTDLRSSNFTTEFARSRTDCGTSSLLVSTNNYPNPFSESTVVNYTIQYDTDIQLSVFSMDGKMIHNEQTSKLAGTHKFVIHKDQLDGAGVYMYKIQTSNNSLESRMILMK